MVEVKQLVDPTVGISCHAWSPSFDAIAYAPNSHELRIADASGLEKFKLNEHDMLISAMDWHPKTNFIVTCSHDRNAFVWTFEEDKWKPLLVILRIERAALDVKWSPDGQKFAVGSSAKCVPICYYEQDNNWWVSKVIKKHKSSVLSTAWHPNSQILASGASDFKARVFSAFISGVDTEQVCADFAAPVAFGDAYAEFNCQGWVHAVSYSPSGNVLAFAGHDASIHFVTFSKESPVVQTLRFSFLPLLQLLFLSDTKLVGAGHDANPALFELADSWSFSQFVDKKPEAKAAVSSGSDVKSRMAMWQNKDKTGTTAGAKNDDLSSWMKHQAAITSLKPYKTNQFSTTSPDGKLVTWVCP